MTQRIYPKVFAIIAVVLGTFLAWGRGMSEKEALNNHPSPY